MEKPFYHGCVHINITCDGFVQERRITLYRCTHVSDGYFVSEILTGCNRNSLCPFEYSIACLVISGVCTNIFIKDDGLFKRT